MKDDFSEPAVSGQTRFIKKVFLLDSDQYLKDRKDKKIKTVSRQTWFTKKR